MVQLVFSDGEISQGQVLKTCHPCLYISQATTIVAISEDSPNKFPKQLMIALYFLSKFNFMSVYFIWWVFLFLLQGFSSSVDGDCHALAFYHVVHSQHTWVCNTASLRNGKRASFVPGLGTLVGSLLPRKHLETWLSFGKWEGSRQLLGHCRDQALEMTMDPYSQAWWEIWVSGAFLSNFSFFLREIFNSSLFFT